jgi:hypothetical protein
VPLFRNDNATEPQIYLTAAHASSTLYGPPPAAARGGSAACESGARTTIRRRNRMEGKTQSACSTGPHHETELGLQHLQVRGRLVDGHALAARDQPRVSDDGV